MESTLRSNQHVVQVEAMVLDADVFGNRVHIHPVLIWDTEGATLVDAGYPGLATPLRQAIEQRIGSLTRLRRILITHHDWDHTGALPDLLQAAGGQAQLYAHAAEKPYIEGALPPLKLTPERIAARIAALPAEQRTKAASVFASLPTATVQRTMADGDLLPFHGGIAVIHVPGHTPGNVCLYLPSRRLLIAGDQLRVDNGVLVGPAPEHTPDLPQALRSLSKLVRYDIDIVFCYHGGPYGPGAAARVAELAALRDT